MFLIVDKIDRAVESKLKCTLIDKMGKYHEGVFTDSWVRVSGAKLRGKVRFQPEGKVEFELDANDILDVLIRGEK